MKMNFVVATLRETKRTILVNMSNVMTMVVRKQYVGDTEINPYTEITFVNGDMVDVDESLAELINGVM